MYYPSIASLQKTMLEQWGEKKEREMLSLWKEYFSDHKPGFELFTSPMRTDASAVIIGYNAGGADPDATTHNVYMNRFLDGEPEFKLSDKGDYEAGEKDYLVASRIRNYLFCGKEHLLADAVETNRYFLRTAGKVRHYEVMKSVSNEAREAYEGFCRNTIQELIEKTEPRVVVDFSGEYTADEFCADLGLPVKKEDTYKYTGENGTEVSIDVGKITNELAPTVVSIRPHISYPPLAMEHLNYLKQTVPPHLPD